ncbi:MAG: phosphoribosyl-AMP cyclohydrolase [Rhizobiales bacterium PAR1]|nr:MAG: phosphoribosyl-AMP cyclohydrolase [Rhizobiales bacterium PAR1]
MWTASTPFAAPGLKADLEEGAALTPRFNADGLITAITVDHATSEILMLAHMNAEALAKTLESGNVWYFSRSRNELWRKGATSGNTQRMVEMRVDCDQDAVLIRVEQIGPACHTNRRSCFYRRVEMTPSGPRLKSE